jgi:hypothetical protein
MAVRNGAVLRFLLQGRVSRWQIALKSHRRACYKGKGKSEGKIKKKKREKMKFLTVYGGGRSNCGWFFEVNNFVVGG